MDPLSFQTANPFTTFYPPQGTEYDAYAAVGGIAIVSSQITLTCHLDPCSRIPWSRYGPLFLFRGQLPAHSRGQPYL